MRRPIMLMMAACMLLSGCGVKRPLLRPEEIPAHELKRQKRIDQYKDVDANEGDESEKQ